MTAAQDRKMDAILADMHSDLARETFRAMWSGDMDEDLELLVRNMNIRIKNRNRGTFKVGDRVRIVNSDADLNGQEGTIVKHNPKRIVVFLDSDHADWMPPLAKMTVAEKRDYANYGFPVGMLEAAV
jgi:hypothetical protein